MSSVGTCPHFLLNPIIANFDLCFCHYHCNWLASIIIFTITTLFINPRNLFTLTLIQRHSNIVDSAISGPPECCPIFHFPLVRPFSSFFPPSSSPPSLSSSLDSGHPCHPPSTLSSVNPVTASHPVQPSTVQCSPVQSSTAQNSPVQPSTVQYSPLQFSTLQFSRV